MSTTAGRPPTSRDPAPWNRGLRRAGRRIAAAWTVITGTGAAASTGLGLLVLVCVLIGVAAPRQSLGLRTRALQRSFAGTTALARSVFGSIDYPAYNASAVSGIGAGTLTHTQASLRGNVLKQGVPLAPAADDWSGLSTSFSLVTGAARSAYDGSVPPQMEVLYRSALSHNARLIMGRLPTGATVRAGGTSLQVAVTQATARRFGLRPGSLLRGSNFSLTVTGIVVPRGAQAAFWTADPIAATPSLNQTLNSPPNWIGAAFIGAPELQAVEGAWQAAQLQLSWDFPLALAGVTAEQAAALNSNLAGALNRAGEVIVGNATLSGFPTSISLTSGLTLVLSAFVSQDQAIARVMTLLSVSLTVIGAVVILLVARLLAENRDSEFAVMRARGAARRQVALLALRAGAVVSVPAAVAGGALALALTPHYSDPLAWWLAGLTVAVALGGPALIAARSNAVGMTGRQRPDRSTRRAALRRLVAEAALVAAAVGGLAVLRRQGLATGSDLYPSAVPVLIAVPVAIVVMRCYPFVIRILLRAAGVRPGVTVFVALARAGRTSVSALLPAFALVLTLAVVAFAAMVSSAVHRGQVAASWQRLGADAVISTANSVTPVSPALQRKIAAVPGVTAIAGISVTSGSAPSGQPVGIAVLDPAQYAALVATTPRPPFAAAKLARPARAGAPIPVLASALAQAQMGRGETRIGIGVTHYPIQIVGTTGGIPAVTSGGFIVMPAWALGGAAPDPTSVLVTGSHIDQARLTATVTHAILGGQVTFRSHVLAGLAAAPLPHGADTAFLEATVAAAGFSGLILLITLVLTARSREFTVARLRVMGLSRDQARWLTAVEVLPQVLAATAGGAAAAWGLASLVGPAIDLTAFTGGGRSVAIRVEPLSLAATAVALIAVALLALTVQVAIADMRGASRALRVAE